MKKAKRLARLYGGPLKCNYIHFGILRKIADLNYQGYEVRVLPRTRAHTGYLSAVISPEEMTSTQHIIKNWN